MGNQQMGGIQNTIQSVMETIQYSKKQKIYVEQFKERSSEPPIPELISENESHTASDLEIFKRVFEVEYPTSTIKNMTKETEDGKTVELTEISLSDQDWLNVLHNQSESLQQRYAELEEIKTSIQQNIIEVMERMKAAQYGNSVIDTSDRKSE